MRRSLFLLLLLAFFLASKNVAQTTETPKGWKLVKTCQFSFLLPQDMRDVTESPIDSCLAAFEKKDIQISLDYGWYSSPAGQAEWDKEFKTSKITINGRSAQLITFIIDTSKLKTDRPVVTKIHIITDSSNKDWPRMTTSLLFTISAKENVDPDIVKRIYESIKFLGN
jgi:hypothetical protein